MTTFDVLCSGGCGEVQARTDHPDFVGRHKLYCARCEQGGKNVSTFVKTEAPSAVIRKRATEIAGDLGKGLISTEDAVVEIARLLSKLP